MKIAKKCCGNCENWDDSYPSSVRCRRLLNEIAASDFLCDGKFYKLRIEKITGKKWKEII